MKIFKILQFFLAWGLFLGLIGGVGWLIYCDFQSMSMRDASAEELESASAEYTIDYEEYEYLDGAWFVLSFKRWQMDGNVVDVRTQFRGFDESWLGTNRIVVGNGTSNSTINLCTERAPEDYSDFQIGDSIVVRGIYDHEVEELWTGHILPLNDTPAGHSNNDARLL